MAAKLDSSPISLPAAADLRTKLFRFGKMVAGQVNVCTVAGERASLIIGAHQKQLPVAGDAVDCYIERVMLVEAGAAFAADADLTTDAAGKAKAAGAGDVVNAVAIDAAAADGEFVRCRMAFSKPQAANVADNNAVPGSLVVHTFLVPDAATGDIDIIVSDKIEVLNVECIKRNGAGAGNTMQIKNGATAITNAIACDTDDVITRAGTIIDGAGTNVILAGGTLRLTATRAAGTRDARVTVYAIKRA